MVIKIDVPKEINAGEKFKTTITASDDEGIVAIAVKFNNKTQTLKAKSPFKKSDSFTINLEAPKKDQANIEVVALDTKKVKSAVNRSTLKILQTVPVASAPVSTPNIVTGL